MDFKTFARSVSLVQFKNDILLSLFRSGFSYDELCSVLQYLKDTIDLYKSDLVKK